MRAASHPEGAAKCRDEPESRGVLAESARIARGAIVPLGGIQAGDYDALFFPVNPGAEEDSWERFYKEAFNKFISGEYAGDYEAELIKEFEDLLPETPHCK